jgi:hypothetical protein
LTTGFSIHEIGQRDVPITSFLEMGKTMVRITTLSRYVALLCFVALLSVLPGCGGGDSKEVAENWKKIQKEEGGFDAMIKKDQTRKQVTDLLGAPSEEHEQELSSGGFAAADESADAYKLIFLYWEKGDKGYVVQFRAGKVWKTESGSKNAMASKKGIQ